MPRHEHHPREESVAQQKRTRTVALISLAVAFTIGVFTWVGLSGAADKGVARIARIDAARASCDTLWRSARSSGDTAAVDMRSLRDTIDEGSSAELTRCGHLRRGGLTTGASNKRDMTTGGPDNR